jgi:uncharacterized protein YbbC (DUF1343 family)
MINYCKWVFLLNVLFFELGAQAQNEIRTGAERTEQYIHLLKNKRIAITGNQTSIIKNVHLVDTLRSLDINIVKIFCPEHGFRGTADAGAHIGNYVDSKTGIPVISLYGTKKKPSKEDLQNIDIVIFDIQDVGVRFYTYISTLHYLMEACAENNVALIILDRPNPNGFFVDGPVLHMKYKSFVGMHPVPLVHGMTIGEYATMINGEKWLSNGVICEMEIIKCEHYTHSVKYVLPVKPSPNLSTQNSIMLYPSLGLFEGTVMSVGRGTAFPFQVVGHPALKNYSFSFIPKAIKGASMNPPFKDQTCYGIDLRNIGENYFYEKKKIELKWLLETYHVMPDKSKYFNNFLNNLIGNAEFKQMIISGKSEEEIRQSWDADLQNFLPIRKKYLLYEDF